ncbi:HlyD family efflux transporter periplasmic adaptor subunit [Aestuariibacter halophilus]|uniref:HlyD family efflux transporter periplasmic adaptor subunit n=1 Tax=Fluctibacter halophilus TaxID=226011 RepID=A0ABS8GCI4_9ALTE|nr:HlyD family efflux transporter periplasmic adaptor subunit [Aestuariibacter halophilus]MCC2618223.1 HlyD family efflux transporter periplasmic adaptor subunit [Aestuariibacter halophilus]
MHQPLFRQAAIDAPRNAHHGQPLLQPTRRQSLFALMVLLLLCAAVAWLTLTQRTQYLSVNGWLVPENGLLRVYAPRGIDHVESVLVNEGDRVQKGQVVAHLRHAQSSLGRDVTATLWQQQLDAVAKQAALDQQLLSHQRMSAQQQLASARRQQTHLESQLDVIRQRIASIQQQVARTSRLVASNVAARETLTQRQQQLMSEQNTHLSVQQQHESAQATVQQHLAKLEQIRLTEQQQRIAAQASLSQLNRQMALQQTAQTYAVLAPADGIIANLHVVAGQRVADASPVVKIIPRHSRLLARLAVPTHMAGQLIQYQSVRLRIDAFPYRQFGSLKGTVIDIDDAVTLPSELQDSPLSLASAAYLVTVAIDATDHGNQVSALLGSLRLGMTLIGDIATREQSMLAWMLEPLKGFRS